MRIAPGTVAYCSQGRLGLILSEQPETITYADGTSGQAWTGICLLAPHTGQPWSSREPLVVASDVGQLIFQRDTYRAIVEGPRASDSQSGT